ncbi:MAG: type II toxin-antitoxin system VapC family toxin [Acidobacteria bacterium]|nr:type II toxin-antitoxin system VapC family toxin [Acidobacteriota bacterium]
MNGPVVDCSITVAWVLGDEESTATLAVLELVQQQGAVAAAVWWAEVRNALIRAERRGRMSLYGTEVALAALDALAIRLDGLPDSVPVLALTRAHRLSVYDAMYLELALRERRPLATLDRQLAVAARTAGAEVLGISVA